MRPTLHLLDAALTFSGAKLRGIQSPAAPRLLTTIDAPAAPGRLTVCKEIAIHHVQLRKLVF
jgi:hypothetical protein